MSKQALHGRDKFGECQWLARASGNSRSLCSLYRCITITGDCYDGDHPDFIFESDLAGQVNAIESWHEEIGHNQIGLLFNRYSKRAFAITGSDDLITLSFQY